MTLLKTKMVVMPTNSDVKESEKHLVPSSARLKKKLKKGNSLWHSISLFLFFVVALKKANPNASDQKMLHKTTGWATEE